jgi:hypothetical protein
MRFKLLFAVLAFCLAPSAFAHSKPIYFLVDASGSMQGQNKADAELLLRALSLPRGQLVSVVYFGKKPATPGTNLCFETLNISEPTPRGDDFAPELLDLGGRDDQTAITNAIDKVLEKAVRPSRLIVITDGKEACNTHFADIRQRHPDAEIEVRQVGDTPNPELQKLEERPPSKLPVVSTGPPINIAFSVDDSQGKETAWEAANWLARYFWVLPYALLALAAWFFGSSYGNEAQRYELAIEKLQNDRRAAAEYFARTNERLPVKWPKFLTASEAMTDGVEARKASLALVLLSCTAGIPLIILSGAYFEAAVAVKVATPVLILTLLFAGPRVWKNQSTVAFITTPKAQFALALGIIAVAAVHFVIDGESARGAAWMVLSSGFSAALAIVASAPLLFAGSQLGKLDRVRSSYKSTWDHGIDETHREDLADARRKEEERKRFFSKISSWMFPASAANSEKKSRSKSLEKDKRAVIKYLVALVRETADAEKNAGDNATFSKLHQTDDLLRLIRAIVGIPELKLTEKTRNALARIADAYDTADDWMVAQAFSGAAKVLPLD